MPSPGQRWFSLNGWTAFPFQMEAWEAVHAGKSGLVNAPTGSGKTYSLLIPFLERALLDPPKTGLQLLWITPIRALSKEIAQAAERAIAALALDWQVDVRTGDTSAATKARQNKQLAQLLITTPESLHQLLAQKGYATRFNKLQGIVADEWHELLGSKRGVQLELAITRLRALNPTLQTWGISATIGNLQEALEVLVPGSLPKTLIRATHKKSLQVATVLPEEVEILPWAGHLGIRMMHQVLPLFDRSGSILLFTNTRSQAEIWYQKLLDARPALAGQLAMHHGSIAKELREWVEDALYQGTVKAVVCTSSLDLGVDFRPVDTVIQVGSPKGVARFLQRAGRSGHQPGATSTIFFVPTHSLELLEAAALREAMEQMLVEDRLPITHSLDVLVQYLLTLSVSDGFEPQSLFQEVRTAHAYRQLSWESFCWCLDFITTGGSALQAYPDYHKAVVEEGIYRITSRKMAMRHRMSIGTIVSEAMMQVRLKNGAYLGTLEEYFISKLNPGDVFWFAGRSLELLRVKDLVATVQPSTKKTGKVVSYMGGRMPLSAQMGLMLRKKLEEAASDAPSRDVELELIQPLIALQKERSVVPVRQEVLLEKITTEEGCHLFVFPFEGRFVHEGLAALLAYRLSLFTPISFSIAMNDYGFELLADQDIPIEEALDSNIFSLKDLEEDLLQSANHTEMAKRRFRDIARIAGLIFTGFPGQRVKDRHLQSNAHLLFEVFAEHEPDHPLLQQAYREVLDFQLETKRMQEALERINSKQLLLKYPPKPTPLAFPIMVDRLSREQLSSERLEDRIRRMQLDYS